MVSRSSPGVPVVTSMETGYEDWNVSMSTPVRVPEVNVNQTVASLAGGLQSSKYALSTASVVASVMSMVRVSPSSRAIAPSTVSLSGAAAAADPAGTSTATARTAAKANGRVVRTDTRRSGRRPGSRAAASQPPRPRRAPTYYRPGGSGRP